MKYKVTEEDIRKVNPKLGVYPIIGEVLRIPYMPTKAGTIVENPVKDTVPKVAEKNPKKLFKHKVKRQETIYSLTKKYNITEEQLYKYNPVLKDGLKKGQWIFIPVVSELGEAVSIDSTQLIRMIENKFNVEKETEKLYNFAVKSEVYNVALMLPLYLDEINSIEVHDVMKIERAETYKSFSFIQFYEGFMLAVDTLQKSGLSIKLFVYDVNVNLDKLETILSNPEMNEMDLIVGPLFTTSFKVVSRFAKENDINIINPFSPKVMLIEDNPQVFKIIPSFADQLIRVCEYISDSFTNGNIILVHNGSDQEMKYAELIKSKFNINHDTFNPGIKEIICSPTGSVEEVLRSFVVGKENILITLSNNEVFILNFIRHLKNQDEKYNIFLFGMPEWQNYNIETRFLLKLRFHTFLSSYVDYDNEHVEKFIFSFRKKYLTEPSLEKFAFQGYDIGLYFLSALNMFGRDFDKYLKEFDVDLLHTKFDFRKENNDGFKNQYINIVRYEDFKLIDVRKLQLKMLKEE